VPEFCNAADDDCDGLTDEGFDLDFDVWNCGACGTVCPARAHAVPACVLGECDFHCESGWADANGVAADGCEATCVPPADRTEVECNGVDNDCDGLTDEDYVPYQCGSGPCVRDSVCRRGETACEPRDPPATVDTTCDDIDDDCDGTADEDGDCTCAVDGDCDDGNPCTTDVCRPSLRCLVSPTPDNGPCAGGICCAGTCVDHRASAENCGTCGRVCGPGSLCDAGTCACNGLLLNCDDDWANGCETNGGTDPANCGGCGALCGAHATCAAASCACADPYLDCNGTWLDGCEINGAADDANCGSCGHACGAGSSCGPGGCGCTPPFLDCDLSPGCETDGSSDAAHCGSCTVSCGSNATCTASACACTGRWLDCNATWSDGCEADPLNDPLNCGRCGNGCGAHTVCGGGSCACGTGYGDCNSSWGDGCETSLTSLTDCGRCGQRCDLANATESCATGTCTLVECNSGWGDCAGGTTDGCETSLTGLSNCGRCGRVCNPANATGASCASGSCTFGGCTGSYGNCNGDYWDGCETSLTSLANCGRCGQTCDLQHAGESCASGTCTLGACDAGWGNCDSNPATGCEQNIWSSTSCGTTCAGLTNCTTLPHVSGASCSSGSCTITGCSSGWGNCDGSVGNGCEQNMNQATSCGTSCSGLVNCTALPHVDGASCSSGTCSITCSSGYGNCDGNPGNGCETNLNADATCGTSCAARTNCDTLAHVSGGSCSGGACTITGCASGYAECNNVVSDGCERLLDDYGGTCTGAPSLGTISGDTDSDTVVRTLWGNMWYTVHVDENDDWIDQLKVTVSLEVPPGVDYDLYVYCSGGCSGGYLSSVGLAGVDEEITARWGDSWGSDDHRDLYIEVRFYSGSTLDCGTWTLTVQGNSSEGDDTCG
jgi:hypothetical protein